MAGFAGGIARLGGALAGGVVALAFGLGVVWLVEEANGPFGHAAETAVVNAMIGAVIAGGAAGWRLTGRRGAAR